MELFTPRLHGRFIGRAGNTVGQFTVAGRAERRVAILVRGYYDYFTPLQINLLDPALDL